MKSKNFPRSLGRWSFGIFVLAIAATLIWLGGRLLLLGGSPYYVLAGALVAGAGLLFIRGNFRAAASLYGIMLAATLIWALVEVGIDGWGLLPRLLAPIILGVFFLIPLLNRRLKFGVVGIAALLVLGIFALNMNDESEPAVVAAAPARDVDWPHWGNDQGGTRFSTAAQVTPGNVRGLRQAWVYTMPPSQEPSPGFVATPIEIGNKLYLCSGTSQVIALDAISGRELWRFDPKVNVAGVFHKVCRGVAYYRVASMPVDSVCSERIYAGTLDARLLALDARTGRPCGDFGTNGFVDLRRGMGPFPPGEYFPTSAPQVVRGKIVVGGWVTDKYRGHLPGVIRAFDAVSGALVWAWDMGRPDRKSEPPEGESYTRGTPNAWAPMSADETLGLVYVPTGNAGPDYFGGGRRPFDDRYSTSVVAIDAETGDARWSFQTLHHDVWDHDVASQPTLVDLPSVNGVIPALVQPTKQGEIFVLDRRTGRPVKPVLERPALTGGVAGETLSPTQPFSVGMPSMTGPLLTEKDMWGVTPLDQLWCRLRFREARYDGPHTPIGVKPTIVSPGYIGAMNWGSVSISKDGLMIVPTNRMSNYYRLIPRGSKEAASADPRARKPNGTPYIIMTPIFMSPLDIPCQRPPWGMLSGVDLRSGKSLWTRPLGAARNDGPWGIPSFFPWTIGTPLRGGAITTATGLSFIGSSTDGFIRAFDMRNGAELWRSKLPRPASATAMTYVAAGQQYLVIAAGGKSPYESPGPQYVVAYALAESH